MSLQPGQDVEVLIEKPAAGGRMIARHGGQIIFVMAAIPGERVQVRIDRADRQLAFGHTVSVLDASADRRAGVVDLSCGGCLYAHIEYPRQLALKGSVIQDAFTRLGRIPMAEPIAVAPSPEQAYRMRARFHAQGDRVGFYREGTHDICDARATGHMSEAAVTAVERVIATLAGGGCPVPTTQLAENMPADQRVVHVTVAAGGSLSSDLLSAAAAAGGITGCTASHADGAVQSSGIPFVSDSLEALTGGRAGGGTLERHATSFFQANRFLLPALVATVLDAVPAGGDVLDLYAGAGVFSASLAAAGRGRITAVEGDPSSASDLLRNAAAHGTALRVAMGRVEDYLQRAAPASAGTIVVDPPRTGISRAAMQAVVAHGARRVVYVSCDPPTMARDARRLLDGGYRMTSLQAFDLFPNTPHVEAVGVFDQGA